MMFVGTQQTREQKKSNTRERKGQDATKITSAPAESCIQFLWSVMPISMTALTWMAKNIPNRNTIENFTEETDDATCVGQYNFFRLLVRMLSLHLALMIFLLCVAPTSSSLVIMAVSIPHWVVNSDRLSPEEDRFREDYYYEALAFSRHTIDLELDDETMKPEKATEAPRNAGIDPSTMKMKQWYQGHDRGNGQSAREPIEDDSDRLAMRRGDMPPPMLERANPGESWNSTTVISGCDKKGPSWHFPILMTIREEPFKKYRSRTSEKWKRPRRRRSQKKRRWTELCQLATIILVMAPTYDLDTFILVTMEFGRNA